MPPTEDDMGIDAIDSSIEKLEQKTQTLKSVQKVLRDLDEKAELTVIDAHDSALIEVTATAPEPVAEMQKLANIDRFLMGQSHNADDIVYDPENDEYKIDTQFRIDR